MLGFVLDTSSQIASVAAFEDEKLLGEFTVLANRTHSQRLMPMIDAFLKQLSLKPTDFDAFYVCSGPGSFTGVRIGLSTVKAFAQVSGKPVYAFTSLALLCANFSRHEGTVAALLPANRDEVYYGFYKVSGGVVTPIEEGAEPLERVLEKAADKPDLLWVGDVATDCAEQLGGDVARRVDNRISALNAVHLKDAALTASTYSTVKAQYFKKSQAERDLK